MSPPRKSPPLTEEALLQQQKQAFGQVSFADSLLAKGFSNSTISRYLRDAHRFETWAKQENMPPATVRYNDLLYYLKTQRKELQQNTRAAHLNGLKHYFDYQQSQGIITDNPVSHIHIKGIRGKRLYHILSRQELETLYATFPLPEEDNRHYPVAQRNKVMLGFMVYQGLGTRDLTQLSVKDISLQEGRLHIAGTRQSNARDLPLEAAQMVHLISYLMQTRKKITKQIPGSTKQLFVSTGAGTKLHNTISGLMPQLQKISPNVSSIRQLRVSVIVHWLNTYNLRKVQYLAGHRFISSTEAYRLNDLDNMQDDISRYHPIS